MRKIKKNMILGKRFASAFVTSIVCLSALNTGVLRMTTSAVEAVEVVEDLEASSTVQEEYLAEKTTEEISKQETTEQETAEESTQQGISEELKTEAAQEAIQEESRSHEETIEETISQEILLVSKQKNIKAYYTSPLYGVKKNGAAYEKVTAKNTDKWPYAYTIENMLNGYNIVAFGDASMTIHCMGAVLVQGNFTNSAYGFADGDNLPPSYIKGMYNAGIYNSRNKSSNAPLYMSGSNLLEMLPSYPYVNINGAGGFGVDTAGAYISDDYFDFDRAKTVVKQTSEALAAGCKNILSNEAVLHITAGTNSKLTSLDGITAIDIVGDVESSKNTIINITQENGVVLPRELINGAEPSVAEQTDGTAIVWNIPKASSVSVPSQNWVGHVIAPNADIAHANGNYNGALVGQKVTLTASEGHLYPYKGDSIQEEATIEETTTTEEETTTTEEESSSTEEETTTTEEETTTTEEETTTMEEETTTTEKETTTTEEETTTTEEEITSIEEETTTTMEETSFTKESPTTQTTTSTEKLTTEANKETQKQTEAQSQTQPQTTTQAESSMAVLQASREVILGVEDMNIELGIICAACGIVTMLVAILIYIKIRRA